MQLAQVKHEALQEAGVRLVVIGCGEWQPIQNYCGMYISAFFLSFKDHASLCVVYSSIKMGLVCSEYPGCDAHVLPQT